MTVAEVNAVAQAFHAGVANQDAVALASPYHDDARFLRPNMEPAEGRAAIEAAMQQQLLGMGARSLDIEPIEVREAGNLRIEYGRYTRGVEAEGGEPMTDVGRYVVVHETRCERLDEDPSGLLQLELAPPNVATTGAVASASAWAQSDSGQPGALTLARGPDQRRSA
jgi:ketosteroid isomerase-like protein